MKYKFKRGIFREEEPNVFEVDASDLEWPPGRYEEFIFIEEECFPYFETLMKNEDVVAFVYRSVNEDNTTKGIITVWND